MRLDKVFIRVRVDHGQGKAENPEGSRASARSVQLLRRSRFWFLWVGISPCP